MNGISEKIMVHDLEGIIKLIKDNGLLTVTTEEEEKELVRRLRMGDVEAKDELVGRNLDTVIRVIKEKKGDQNLLIEDRFLKGCEGLLKAAERFDPERGFRFRSYAIWWVRKFILMPS